jgi:hypothetical protein
MFLATAIETLFPEGTDENPLALVLWLTGARYEVSRLDAASGFRTEIGDADKQTRRKLEEIIVLASVCELQVVNDDRLQMLKLPTKKIQHAHTCVVCLCVCVCVVKLQPHKKARVRNNKANG